MKTSLKGAFLCLTNKCNLNCKYCYQDSSFLINTKDELSKRDWIGILKELKNLGAKKISFVGGEPLIHKNFWEIINYAYKQGFEIKVFTNGILLNEEKLKKLKRYNVTLSFNLNSHDDKIQDFYQGRGSWRRIIEIIKKGKGQGLKFEIASPLMKKNLKDIDKFFDFCIKLGAKRVRLVPLILIGKAINLKKDRPSKEQIQNLKNRIKNKKIEITIGCRDCEAGLYYLTIQPNGDITPCSINRNFIIENVKKHSMKNILMYIRKSKMTFPSICL